MGRRKIIFACFGVFTVAALAVAAWIVLVLRSDGLVSSTSFRSDTEMIRVVSDHARDFEMLRMMAQEDPLLTTVFLDQTYPENPMTVGVSSERIAAYRTTLRRIGSERGLLVDSTVGLFEVVDRSQGLVSNGVSKSFIYSDAPLETVPSLDMKRRTSETGTWYRSTNTKAWYIKFERL